MLRPKRDGGIIHPLKFAFVMPYYFPDGVTGGAEKQAYLLARELVKRGHEVVFLTLNPAGRPEVENDGGIEVVRRLKRRGKFQFLDYPAILRELHRYSPEVVISRIRFYYLPLSLYALQRNKVSVAFIPENSLSTLFPELRKILKLSLKAPSLKTPLHLLHALVIDLFSQFGLLLSKVIIVQNETQRRNVRRFFFRSSVKLPSIFVPPDVSLEKDREPLIVWVGNARAEKRPQLFVGLAERLPQYRFVMVGRKTERFRGLLPNLTVMGELPHGEALRWIGRAWVLVNTSVDEGFSNTFLEAWYMRTLVMSYSADPDNLISSGLGLKVGSTEGAARELTRVLQNEEERLRIVEGAYKYVMNTHVPDVVVPRFMGIINKNLRN